MSYTISATNRNAMLSALLSAFDGGTLRIYAGSVPINADAGIGGATLLGTLTFANPAFPAPSGGSATANAITQDSAADADGTATFFRSFRSDGTTVIEQGDVTDDPNAWQATTSYVVGSRIVNGGNIYQCSTGGTSAASGGPTGTGAAINDGTVVWAYQSPLGALRLNTVEIKKDGPIQISNCTRYI